MNQRQSSSLHRRTLLAGFVSVAVLAFAGTPAFAQSSLSPEVLNQLSVLRAEKAGRTPAQQKVSSNLLHAGAAANALIAGGANDLVVQARTEVALDTSGNVRILVNAESVDAAAQAITALGGVVTHASQRAKLIDAVMPLSAVDALAESAAVRNIQSGGGATTNVGALNTQGYISHKANTVVNSLGINGNGVTVGVLSDSANNLPTLIASGDLGPQSAILPGKAGPANGSNEGGAMMEIVQDMAPGAKVLFATAFDGVASFADNIRALAAAGASVIVDDVSYFNEGVFQDGPIAQAVNDVTAAGVLYFSSAGNSGNVTSGTAGVWEGDFNPGAVVASPDSYTLHRFPNGLDYNVLTAASSRITLKWSDRLGNSANDYDLWVTNAAGNSILCYGGAGQTGVQDPYEICSGNLPAGSRVYIGNYLGTAAPRALHLNTNRGRLQTFTSGVVYGHNAAANTVSTAAVFWNAAKTGTKPFVGGAANPTESFSSDGPRRMFYNADGTQITPGNLLFGTGGGTVLAKPDIAAADGVSTKTPGFLPFYGTSAAAPHAAGIAALVKAARPGYTRVQILNAMRQTALDIRAPGVDRDSGVGIVRALEAVQWALSN